MKVSDICKSAAIAALYVVLTYLSSFVGLASGAIQVRVSEALCILPVFTETAIPGLTVGCVLANVLTGGNVFDVIFGSLATYIGAVGTYRLRKYRYINVIPPILCNALIISFVLKLAYGLEDTYIYLFATVGAGEVISAGVLGTLLEMMIKRYNIF